MTARRATAALLLAAIALVPAAADGASKQRKRVKTVEHSRHLWATVNACDLAEANEKLDIGPNAMAVRASMPGSRDGRENMYMRFRAQYFSESDEKWHNFSSKAADSGWLGVGKARYKARQKGTTFVFKPVADKPLRLRGKVNFRWRLRGKIVRKATKLTTRGHRSAAYSSPKGYSSAECTITA